MATNKADTPIFRSSSDVPHSAATGQKELKGTMKFEFANHVYRSDRLFEKIFKGSLSPGDIDKVTHDCLLEFTNSVLPTTGKERDSYPLFVKHLNAVKKSLGRHALLKRSIYKHVRFETYDKQTKEGTANDAPLKPDVVARTSFKKKTEPVSWDEVELCAEAKDKYADMVAQGATYARSIFHAQKTRNFVLIIFYEHKKRNVSFGLFTPAWLCLSFASDLGTAEGQKRFIRDMAQIWSCEHRWSAGFDMTRNNRRCYLGEHGTYMLEEIFHRVSVRGRRTRVDLMRDDSTQKETESDSKLPQILAMDQYFVSGESNVQATSEEQSPDASEEHKETRNETSVSLEETQLRRSLRIVNKATNEGSSTAPVNFSQHPHPCDLPVPERRPALKTLIMKDSWPILSRERQEERVFKDVGSKFGVPGILDSFAVPVVLDDGQEMKSDTTWTFPDDAKLYNKLWNVASELILSSNQQSSGENAETQPEHRVHVRILISTEGMLLYNAKSPRELLQTVLHAMMGYWVIFQKGWLHRDVSIGNMLMMRRPEERDRVEGFDHILTESIYEKYFQTCIGFITDGDLAVNWQLMDRETARQRSGTPPFMSCRLIRAMITDIHVTHSPVDDLESFVWVLFWAVLYILETQKVTFTAEEKDFWSCLRSRDLRVLRGKSDFAETLQQQKNARSRSTQQSSKNKNWTQGTPSPGFEPFIDLLLEWLDLARSLGRQLSNDESEDYSESLKTSLEKYLEIGVAHLEKLPSSWEYIQLP